MIFLGPKIIKGSHKKLLSYYFYRFFQFFTLVQVGTGQIYYFREFINLPSINLKNFYCTSILLFLVIKNYKEIRVRFKIDVTNNDKKTIQNLEEKK